MLRHVFLFLSQQKRLRNWAETSALARRMSARFVAGETLDRAVETARRMRAEGITVTLDRLGENVASLEDAAASSRGYVEALSGLEAAGLEPNVSLKLTQFGMDLSESQCRANVERVVCHAARMNGGFVRVDMESGTYTNRTLALVTDLHARYGSVGAVIQAYLYRSRRDVEALCARGIRVRLCKGAYLEPPGLAFPRKRDVDRNYLELMRYLLENGTYPAIATHDERMIEEARRFPADRFEFQMLYGIRRDLQRQLARAGYRVRLYVPYGTAWYPYFMRRLAERPANVLFLARNLLKK